MPQLTTTTVLWDDKQPAMEMKTPLAPGPMAFDSLQAPISPFSLGNSESSPSPSPSPSSRNEEQEKQEKGESFKSDSIVVKPSNTINTINTNTHLAELTELATTLARALSYTEGYDLDRRNQTQKGMNNVYELQTLTRRPSVRVAGHRHRQSVGVEDSHCSPRPISRKVRAERRARRYALV